MDVFAELAPVSDNYAVLPVGEAFNWAPVANAIEPGEWYMVAFRSIVRSDADQERLHQYDDWAHEEASGADGCAPFPTVIDASAVTFLDCRGLGYLIRRTGAERRDNRRPQLRCPSRIVRRVIGLAQAEELFTVTP